MRTKMKSIIGLLVFSLSLNAQEIYATFTVEAKKSAKLAFDASGITKTVNYEVSDTVKKGAILASLKNEDSKASLDMAKTALKFAQKDYERQLQVKELIDAGKFDQYAFKYEDAKKPACICTSKV
jgi:membrane fusion protein, multidrug efflux system